MIKAKTIKGAYDSLYRIRLYVKDAVECIEIYKTREIDIDEVIAYLRSLCEDINNLHNFIINVEHENQKEY